MFGTLEDFDALLAGRPRARHEARDGPRRQPHLRRAPVVRRVALVERDNPKRDWYWWRPPSSRQQLGARSSPAPAWELDEATGEHYLHLFSPQAARPQLGEPGGPRGRLRDDALVARPRGRRLPHGRHQLHLQGPALPDGAIGDAAGAGRRRRALHLRPAHPRVPAGDAPGGVRRPRRALLTVGEMPGVTVEEARALHRPGARRGRHGLPVRARRPRPGRGTKWDVAPARPARPQGARSGAGRTGWPSRAGTACTGTTTTSRGSSPASATTAQHRVRSAKLLATVLHLHRGTPYVYQGEELGMTNVAVRARSRTSATSSRSTTTPRRSPAGEDPDGRARRDARRCSRDNARTPMQWDASPHAGFTTGEPWIAVNPEPHRDQRARGRRGSRLGLPPLPAADRAAPRRAGRRARRLHDAARRTTRASTPSRAASATSSCWCWRTSPASPPARRGSPPASAGRMRSC